MGFGQAETKRCGGWLKVISWEWWCKPEKGDLFIGKAGFHYVILLYCETLLQVLLGICCKRFYWIPLFTILLLFYVFEVGKAKSATQSVLMILTLNGLFQKIFYIFYSTPENSIFLTLTPPPLLPPLFVFSIIVTVLWFLTATILLIQPPLVIQSHKNS